MKPLSEHFERVRKSLLTKAEEVGVLKHAGLKGIARELLISDFLAANLPRAFDFETGEIVGADDTRSGQIDVLIVLQTTPRFRLGGPVCLALVHGVAAALEVKSVLTTSTPDSDSALTEAMKSTVAVKSLPIEPPLDPWPWSATLTKTGEHVRLDNIPVSIIAFKGPDVETLLEHLDTWEQVVERNRLPNTITCLKENYTLALNDGWRLSPRGTNAPTYFRMMGDGMALGDLYDHLMKVLQGWIHHHPDTPLSRYLE
jgi:hypothetical protein